MWAFGWFNTIAEQVIRYSTFFGQMWYIVVFVFRFIVVLSLGSTVYGDEQSNFKCSAIGAGCDQACYNQFTEISHLRFWGFQLLSVITPIIFFHFLASYFAGQLAKIKAAEEKTLQEQEDGQAFHDDRSRNYEDKKTRNRRKIVGKVKQKKVYDGKDLKEIPINDKIKVAYFISVVLRLAAEAVFLYLTYLEYNYPDYLCHGVSGLIRDFVPEADRKICHNGLPGVQFLWATFPEVYPCERRLDSGVFLACAQNIAYRNSVVPCWTSRAFEKTIYLRYMNILSAVSFILCVLEIIYIPIKEVIHVSRKRSSRVQVDYYRDYPRPPPQNGRDMPLRSQHSGLYNTQAEYSSRPASYYDQERDRPRHPPPNETTAKRYDEYKA